MNKILKKHIITLILAIICVINISNISFAEGSTGIDFGLADSFLEAGKNATEGGITDLSDIGSAFSSIGNTLVYIGAGVLVGATAYMGIQYLVSSPDKQAKLKEQSIGLVVSAIVIFGAYGIWQIVVNLLGNIVG